MLNNWRMAQLHAQEAPERVWELEEWGALFDRTKDGKISQRDFGGHRYARLAHVGDRTGLEMIRTLQQRAVDLGIDVYMECTVTKLLKEGSAGGVGRIAGTFGYWRETGSFIQLNAPAVIIATGGIGKSFKVTSNSWEYTGDGHALALSAGANLINMEFVQFHPTGMVWPLSVRGLLITESVRGDGGVLAQLRGQALHVRLHHRLLQSRDGRHRRGSRPLVRRPHQQPSATGAAAARRGRPRDQHRGQGRPRLTARRRLPRHRDAAQRGRHPQAAAVDVPPVQGAGGRRHHHRPDGGRPDRALRHGRRRGRPRRRRLRRSRACSRSARPPAACTAPTGSAATRSATCWCSASGRGVRGRLRREALPPSRRLRV